jgi:hypothetical protein
LTPVMMREPPLPLPLPGGLRLLRLEHGLEVDFGQQDRREAGARADVGHDGAQVGVDHLRADDAHDALHLVGRHVADLEDAGLLGLDQEQHLVLDLGGDGGGDGDLEDAVGHALGAHAPRLMSTCGCCCSSRICGELGCSSDRSFRYMRWIWNTGVLSAMVSRVEKQNPPPIGGRVRLIMAVQGRRRAGPAALRRGPGAAPSRAAGRRAGRAR